MERLFNPIQWVLLLVVIPLTSYSQDSTYLNIGNINALIHSDGNLFQDIYTGRAAFEVPKGSNINSIFASSFWMSSESTKNGRPHYAIAVEQYGSEDLFNVGPVDIVNQLKDSSTQFQRLWKVSKAEIDQHVLNWNTSGYNVPNNILDWPGNGNANTARNLAPYVDLDGDSIYEPQNGEYPLISGDEAVYLILNDYRSDQVFI